MSQDTTAAEGTASVQVDNARFQRVLEALTLVALQNFEASRQHLGVQGEDAFGELEGVLEIFVRELEQATQEAEDAKQRANRLIAEQAKAIQALSTPIIEVWEDILTLPVVGTLDEARANDMTERLLRKVVDLRARCVIIDLTGVDVVDTQIASQLVKMTASARLLGSHCVITGIGPNVAITLAGLGLDFGDVPTMRNLKAGLQHCIEYLDG